jgi:hypothetical protein
MHGSRINRLQPPQPGYIRDPTPSEWHQVWEGPIATPVAEATAPVEAPALAGPPAGEV